MKTLAQIAIALIVTGSLFQADAAPQNLEALNSRIYAQLFLTPNSDPWLGLAPADAFSALENSGLVQSKTQ